MLSKTYRASSLYGRRKSKHVIELAKAAGNAFCTPFINNAKIHLDKADKMFKRLEEVYTAIRVKGRNYHSKPQLDACKDECEELYKLDKEIETPVKALEPLMTISPACVKG